MINTINTRVEDRKLEHWRKKNLPQRSKIIKIPIKQNSQVIGVAQKQDIQEDVFLAELLTRIVDGHVLTIILNTNETKAEVEEPLLELEKFMSLKE
jgi:hypothetical protein